MKFIILAALLGLSLAEDTKESFDAPAPGGPTLTFGGHKAPKGFNPSAVHHHHKERRAATCGVVSTLTAAQQTESVNTHNYFRALEPAANMLKLVYSEEMSRVAQGYANKCTWGHGDLYDCSGARLGQNLYVSANPNGYPALNVTKVIAAWNGEKKDYTFQSNSCTPGAECGHYTQNCWARSGFVGCGFAQCASITVGGQVWTNAIYLVCDYTGPGNVAQSQMYQPGAACSACDTEQTGAGYKCDSGLCAACQPATDSSCKCGTPTSCTTGSWNPGTCSCQCPPDHYGQQCEIPCTCNDVGTFDCATNTGLCTDPSYCVFMGQYCKKTCAQPCSTLPTSCKSMAPGY